LCAALLFGVASAAKEKRVDRVVLLKALSLLGFSIITFGCFFPRPGVFTGIGAILALMARARGATAA